MSDSRDRDQRSSPTGGGRRRSRSPERAGGRRGSSSGGGGQDDRDSRDRVDINRDRRRSPDRDDRRGGGYNGNNHGNVGGGRGDNRDSRYETFVHKSHRTVPGTGGPPDNYSNVILFIRNIDAKLTRRELHQVIADPNQCLLVVTARHGARNERARFSGDAHGPLHLCKDGLELLLVEASPLRCLDQLTLRRH